MKQPLRRSDMDRFVRVSQTAPPLVCSGIRVGTVQLTIHLSTRKDEGLSWLRLADL